MATWLTSPDQATEPGVFAVEIASPTVIEGIPNGSIAIPLQAPWGPVKTAYKPSSAADVLKTYFPIGFSRACSGYYAIMRRRELSLIIARILGGSEGLFPPEGLSVVTAGAPGAVTYKYKIVAKNATGHTVGSYEIKIATGHAVLDGTNYNVIAWSAVTGATSYDVYLVTAAGNITQAGFIANTASATYSHKGANGDLAAIPSSNTSGWKQAVCYLLDSAGVAVAKLVAKYPGTAGNGLTCVVADAQDADAAKFNVAVSAADAGSGTGSETGVNLKTTVTAILPDLTDSVFLASMALIGTPTTRPANGTYTFTGGADGAAISAADYNDGLAQLALEEGIGVTCADDCGGSIRATVNTDLQTVADAQGWLAVLQDNSAVWATVKANVGSYRDDRVIFCGKMVNVKDDAGVEQLTPFATCVASALINLEPQQSHAWRDPRATKYYDCISSIPTTGWSTGDKTIRGDALTQGICLPIKLKDGRKAALHDRVSLQTVNKRFAVTRRIKDFSAASLEAGLDIFVNGPNILEQQQDEVMATKNFMEAQKRKGRYSSYDDPDIKTPNNSTTAALGQFFMNLNVKTPAPQEKIFLGINMGPGVVTVTAP